MITNQLADTLSRNGGIGLAKSFERQLGRTRKPPRRPPPAGRRA